MSDFECFLAHQVNTCLDRIKVHTWLRSGDCEVNPCRSEHVEKLRYHEFGICGYQHRLVDRSDGTTVLHIEQPCDKLRCPNCGSANVTCQGSQERELRSLPIGHRPTLVYLAVARVCPAAKSCTTGDESSGWLDRSADRVRPGAALRAAHSSEVSYPGKLFGRLSPSLQIDVSPLGTAKADLLIANEEAHRPNQLGGPVRPGREGFGRCWAKVTRVGR